MADPQTLTPGQEAFVASRKLARLATAASDGLPHVVPVAYAYAEGAFWISSDPHDLKVRLLEANPKAALLVDDPPPVKSGLLVRGTTKLVTEGDEFERAQDHLIAAGAHSRTRRRPGEQVYIRLTPARVASWRI